MRFLLTASSYPAPYVRTQAALSHIPLEDGPLDERTPCLLASPGGVALAESALQGRRARG